MNSLARLLDDPIPLEIILYEKIHYSIVWNKANLINIYSFRKLPIKEFC